MRRSSVAALFLSVALFSIVLANFLFTSNGSFGDATGQRANALNCGYLLSMSDHQTVDRFEAEEANLQHHWPDYCAVYAAEYHRRFGHKLERYDVLGEFR